MLTERLAQAKSADPATLLNSMNKRKQVSFTLPPSVVLEFWTAGQKLVPPGDGHVASLARVGGAFDVQIEQQTRCNVLGLDRFDSSGRAVRACSNLPQERVSSAMKVGMALTRWQTTSGHAPGDGC